MAHPVWEIEKSESGATFTLHVGRRKIPGSVTVDGLSRETAEAIGNALYEIERRVERRVKSNIRQALGLNDNGTA